MAFDCCTRVERERFGPASAVAGRLGWKGLGVLVGEKQPFSQPPVGGIDLLPCVEVHPQRPSDVARVCRRLRPSHLLIAVSARDLECARAALETPEADLLIYGGPINYVMAKLSKENGVSVVFDFSRMLAVTDRSRTLVLSEMTANARLVRKFRSPFVLTSGATDEWGLRSPRDLVSWGKTMGLDEKSCRRAVSDAMVRENRKRLGGKWLAPGVERL
jgi:ribonuclease P/MRP protein subunit RPP1